MKIKIIFVLPSLAAGGAERVMSFLASNLDTDKFDPSLLITGNSSEQAYSISESTSVTFLNKSRVKNALLAIALHIHQHKPHIVMGAIGHVNIALAILAIFFRKVQFIGRATIVASVVLGGQKKKKLRYLIPELRPLTLAKIVCQSKDMQEDLVSNFGYPPEKLVTIANPVTSRFLLKESMPKDRPFQLITVGRLVEQKGYLRILDAIGKLKCPFHFTIIGSGADKEKILAHAKKLDLSNHITHIPFTDTVETYLAQSDLFLSGSYVEGFPNVFLESCAVGTPVLAFQAPGGINEIIHNGVNGYIAVDEHDFFEKLILCMSYDWNAPTVRQSVLDKYSEEIIIKNYQELFLSLTR